MRRIIASAVVLLSFLASSPAYAQLGGLSKRIGQAKDAKAKADKVLDLRITDAEERQLGEQVSAKLRESFGVYQDAAVAKYVSLVGGVLARGSSRPSLDWQFIVLDTDGVNAFASPGGFVHITRGALGLIDNEAELAGVLGHEITHVTAKHTVRSIEKSGAVDYAATQAGPKTSAFITQLADAAYKNVINNSFDRNDEVEADRVGIGLAGRAGYAPAALADVLHRIEARNKDREEPNGLFASHPLIKERVANITQAVKDQKLSGTATVAARYTKYITFDVKPLDDIPVIDGSRGLTGGPASKDGKSAESEKKEPPKKKGSLLGKFTTSSSEQKQSSQTIASAGARGGVPDRDAKGGSNPKLVAVTVSVSEIAEFKKGIA